MKIVGTIEARMSATRLPGKTLAEIHDGKPLLEAVLRRFRECGRVSEVVVATTVSPHDDPIARWCADNAVSCFRGSEADVLDRVAGALRQYRADVVVQMGADSAYLDFDLIDTLVATYLAGAYDYVCNDLKLTYPLGLYAHVLDAHKLVELNRRNDLSTKDREDVVRYVFEHPAEYRLLNIEAPPPYRCPELRLTIDYPEDLSQAREVYAHFGTWRFTSLELLALYREQPQMFEKTRHLVQRSAPHLKGPA